MISFLKGNGMHGLSILVFVVLSVSLLSKSYDGYVVRQGDIENHKGMSREASDHRALAGEFPAWTGSMFAGMPTNHIVQNRSPWSVPLQVRLFLSKPFQSSGVFVFFMAMLSAYLLAIALGASPAIALLCGVGFGLSSFEVLYYAAGHNTKVRAMAYLPGIIAGVLWAYRKNLGWGVAIAALYTSLHVHANHYQITYYGLFLLGALGITETVGIWRKTGALKRALLPSLALLFAGIIGVLPSVSEVFETKEYATDTIRGEHILTKEGNVAVEDVGLDREYILEYSMGDGEWWSIMCPDIKGGNSPYYWGEQNFSGGALYFGAILCALFFVFLVIGRDRLRWPLAVITLVTILLTRRGGGVLTDFFLDHVPFFNQFRDTKMMLVLVHNSIAIGVVLILIEMSQLVTTGGEALKKRRNWFMGVMGVIIAVFAAFYAIPEVFFEFRSTIKPDMAVEQVGYESALSSRLEIFRSDVARTLGLLCFAAIVLAATLWEKLAMHWAVIALTVVTGLDLWNVDARYFNDEKVNGQYRNWSKAFDARFPFDPSPQMAKVMEREYSDSPAINAVADDLYMAYLAGLAKSRIKPNRRQKEKLQLIAKYGALRFDSPFRVFQWGNSFTNTSASYFFNSVGGYHAAKLRRYQDFIERVLIPERERFVALAQKGQLEQGLTQMVGLRMLNTRYLLIDQFDDPILMPDVPGFAWVAPEWSIAANDDDEMAKTEALQSPRSAVVHSEFSHQMEGLVPGAQGAVALVSYQPDALQYQANLDAEGLVVFSEVWYDKTWTATIDGNPAEPIRANYVLRALKVPAGEHEVVWRCANKSNNALTISANLLLVIFLFGASWWGIKRSKSGFIEHE